MQKTRTKKPLKITVTLSLFAAISIVCGKYLAINVGEYLRFSFENLPIIMAGVFFGPLAGALVGTVADLVGCVLVGYAINPVVTVGAALIGLVSGSVWMLGAKWRNLYAVRIAATVVISHLVGSVVVKSVGLSAYYTLPLWGLMLWRLLNYMIVGVAEGLLLYILIKNKMIARQFLLKENSREL